MREDPARCYVFSRLKALYGPEDLLPRILRDTKKFRKQYWAGDQLKGDLSVLLDSRRVNFAAALEQRNLSKTAFFAGISL